MSGYVGFTVYVMVESRMENVENKCWSYMQAFIVVRRGLLDLNSVWGYIIL